MRKIVVEAENLVTILTKAKRATPTRDPIIRSTSQIRLKAKDNMLSATGANSDGFFITAWCEAEVTAAMVAEIDVLVPPVLLDIAKSTKSTITLSLQRNSLYVTRAEGETRLSTMDVEGFPIPQKEVNLTYFVLTKRQLAGLTVVLDKEDALVAFRAVYVCCSGDKTYVAAMPKASGRITVVTTTATESKISAILPGKYLGLAVQATGEERIGVGLTHARVTGADCEVVFPLEAGAVYPAEYFAGLLAIETAYRWFPGDFTQFLAELELSRIFSMDGAPCRLEYDGANLLLESGGNDLGHHNAVLGIETKDTEPWKFRVTSIYYVDALKHIGKGGNIELFWAINPATGEKTDYLNSRITDGETFHIISPLAHLEKREVTVEDQDSDIDE